VTRLRAHVVRQERNGEDADRDLAGRMDDGHVGLPVRRARATARHPRIPHPVNASSFAAVIHARDTHFAPAVIVR